MRSPAKTLAGALWVALTTMAQPAAGAEPARDPHSRLEALEAAEVLLRDVCLAGVLDRRPIAELAARERALPVPAKPYGVGADDKVYRLGTITTQVYAVDWADGSCSARVGRGDAEKLRAMAERTILARPEGFTRGASTPEDDGRVMRTVYCARSGDERLVASITLPGEKAGRETVALSSTVYRATGPSAMCEAG